LLNKKTPARNGRFSERDLAMNGKEYIK